MDDYEENISRMIEESKWIEKFTQSQGYCIACGHDDPLDLEYHHVGGRKNSPITVSLCRNCHGRVSRRQQYWPKFWKKDNNPPDKRLAILLRGFSDLFRVISDKHLERILNG